MIFFQFSKDLLCLLQIDMEIKKDKIDTAIRQDKIDTAIR